jgi:hypothetical protein
MCWSASVSLNTFLFSLFGAGFAYFNGVIDIKILLFIISFASMQLVEYFAWKSPKNNKLLSQLGLFLILAQVPAALNAFYKGPHKLKLIGVYILAIIAWFVTSPKFNFSMHKASNGHLAWNWLKPPIWFIMIWLLIFAWSFFSGGYEIGSLLFLSSFAISYYMYIKYGTWGSIWCWLVNFHAIYYVYKVFSKDFCTLSKKILW